MQIYDMEQYSDEYWEVKLGRLSASSMDKIVSATGKNSTSWKAYVFKQLAELETGYHEDEFSNKIMARALDLEPEARKSFTFLSGGLPAPLVGVVVSDKYKFVCCSPDALGDTYGLEIKCPSAGVHLLNRFEQKIPTKYLPQIYTSLWICENADRWYFLSHHPDMTDVLLSVSREDEGYIKYVEALETRLEELRIILNDVKSII